jgi:anti-sigma B factor antagonist
MTAREITSFDVVEGTRAAVVEARGELDASSAGAFRVAIERAAQSGRPLVVVDLERVSFLDSAGLSVIFGVQRQLPVDQRMVLGNVPQRMLRTLRLASVTSVVDVHPADEPQPWQEQPAGGDGAL